MLAGKRPVGNPVAVYVVIAPEALGLLKFVMREDLAAIVEPGIIPSERLSQMRIHADVEIEHDEDRRLQSLG